MVILTVPTEKDLVTQKNSDEELEQLLKENPTQMDKELAHALGVTQRAISHCY